MDGLLLGGVGVGAVAGAAALPRLRSRVPLSVLLTSAMITLAAATAALAYVRVSAAAAIAVVVSGVGWILVLSILNSQYQGTLPGWAKARGMSYYLVLFQGGGAAGAAVFGVLARHAGLGPAMLAASIGLAVVALLGPLMPFKSIPPADLLPAGDWPDPQLVTEATPAGPVLVTLEYRPKPLLERGHRQAVRGSLRETPDRCSESAFMGRRSRSRTRPRAVRRRLVDEHLRQHEGVSRRDQQRLNQIAEMTDPTRPPIVTHWLAAHPNATTE